MEGFNIGETVVRHGDVHLKLSYKTIDGPVIEQCLLHKGQNHHHNLRGEFKLIESDDGKFLDVLRPTELYHEEHKTLLIPVGKYSVDIQVEYDHWLEESRQVID